MDCNDNGRDVCRRCGEPCFGVEVFVGPGEPELWCRNCRRSTVIYQHQLCSETWAARPDYDEWRRDTFFIVRT
jgi:hypothetical protein